LTATQVKGTGLHERNPLEAIANDLFSLNVLFWTVRHRNRVEDPYDLTEPEFVALETLYSKGLCTVGELQQVLDVRPAQMSRIVRALENKAEKSLIKCSINPQDKRKIDVVITDLGRKAHDEYKQRRIIINMDLLKGLNKSEQEEVGRLVNRYRQIMEEMLQHS
jgi:DNA-binding MarR family transcriptional regulator